MERKVDLLKREDDLWKRKLEALNQFWQIKYAYFEEIMFEEVKELTLQEPSMTVRVYCLKQDTVVDIATVVTRVEDYQIGLNRAYDLLARLDKINMEMEIRSNVKTVNYAHLKFLQNEQVQEFKVETVPTTKVVTLNLLHGMRQHFKIGFYHAPRKKR